MAPQALVEFTVYPFVPGRLEPHVAAAVEEARRSGLPIEVGPLGTSVRGELEELVVLLGRVLQAAFAHGATKVVTRLELTEGPSGR